MPDNELRSRSVTRWVVTPSRSDSGLRLMNMRPWLTDAFEPEAPTEEPTPATAGISQHDLERLLLQLRHGLERDVGKRPVSTP